MSDSLSSNTTSTTTMSDEKPEPTYFQQRLAEAKEGVPKKPMVRFKPGQGGPPEGRPKGSRNRVTLVKTDLELTLREFSKKYVPHVLAKALEMALNGDRSMIKLIMDLHMSKPQHYEAEDNNKGTVQILVQNLTTKGGELTVGSPSALLPAVKIEAKVLNGDVNEQTGQSRIDGNSEEHPEVDSDGPKARPDNGIQ